MGELYLQGLKPLTSGSALDGVQIVGSKYSPGAYDFIIKASRTVSSTERVEQCLFLVADSRSNGVMLHNGKNVLGSVHDMHRARVRDLIDALGDEAGQDQVLVCYVPFVTSNNESSIRRSSSFQVYPTHHVFERLARKFADKYRK